MKSNTPSHRRYKVTTVVDSAVIGTAEWDAECLRRIYCEAPARAKTNVGIVRDICVKLVASADEYVAYNVVIDLPHVEQVLKPVVTAGEVR